MSTPSSHYGLMAEFASPEALRAAVEALRERGYRRLEAYSPFAVEGLAEALGHPREWLPLWTLLGGIGGAALSFFIQTYAAVIDYPVNIGGRPLFSWPAFLPISIEFAILGAASCAALALLISNRLPCLYHPVFNVARFEHASRDGFFLCIRTDDVQFDREGCGRDLMELGARQLYEVPA
jgi:hypothetical protein